MAELKPCPFCGGKAIRKYGKYNLLGAYGTQNEARQWFGVHCSTCGVSQPKRKYDTRELATEEWNRRASEKVELPEITENTMNAIKKMGEKVHKEI